MQEVDIEVVSLPKIEFKISLDQCKAMSLESSRENLNIYVSMSDASAAMATTCFNECGLSPAG
jgi:hypothetical protein